MNTKARFARLDDMDLDSLREFVGLLGEFQLCSGMMRDVFDGTRRAHGIMVSEIHEYSGVLHSYAREILAAREARLAKENPLGPQSESAQSVDRRAS